MKLNTLIIKIILIMGLFNFFGCTNKPDLNEVFPYIITKDYLVHGVKEETVFVDTIIDNELYLTIVKDLNGLVENVKLSDLARENISPQQAFDAAKVNLERKFKKQAISATLLDGPNGIPFILFSDHWLSASSLYWTNLFSFVRENLKADSFYVSIPQRDAMIVFPVCHEKELNDFKTMIKEKESDARKPLTWEIFQLNKDGLKRIE